MTFYLKTGLTGAKNINGQRLIIELLLDPKDVPILNTILTKNLKSGYIYHLFRDDPTQINNEYIYEDTDIKYRINKYYTNDEIEFYGLYYVVKLLSGEIIGTIDLYGDSNILEIGIFVDADYAGKNYATEAVEVMIRFLKNNSTIGKLKWQCDVTNFASIRVANKCGFQFDQEKDITPGRSSYVFYLDL